MPCEFKVRRQVEFAETDMAGIMHFSNFFRHMEAVEHAFFRSLGFTIHSRGSGILLGWPRVHARCDYLAPLFFEDPLEIQLLVKAKGSRSIQYLFLFRRLSDTPPRLVARGEFTVVSVALDQATGQMKAVPLPEEIAGQIEVAPAEWLAAGAAAPEPA